MVLEFYRLKREPFGVTPDTRFLFPTATHREALASLRYGIETGRGFLTLIARPGMGKTTLPFALLEQLRETARTVFLFQTVCGPIDLIRYLLQDLGVDVPGQDMVSMHSQLNQILFQEMSAGKRFVLVIDEAQNLSEPVLETARLLSNFETPSSKLMQIVLAGQPELAGKLDRKSLSQLRQRISIFSRLEPFTPAETFAYIDYRLGVAGHEGRPLFTRPALDLIAEYSEGIPRNINNLCFNALSLGCALEQPKISPEIVQEVLTDLGLNSPKASTQPIEPALISQAAAAAIAQASSPAVVPAVHAPAAVAPVVSAPPPQLLAMSSGEPWFRIKAGPILTFAVLALALYVYANFLFRQATGLSAGSSSTALASTQAAQPTDSTEPILHVVKQNETLEGIALSYFGYCNPVLLGEIWSLNPDIANPNLILVGQQLRLPRQTRHVGAPIVRRNASPSPPEEPERSH
jgi:general secretion pathway protein A